MKILFLTRSLDSGGAERQLLNLAIGLRDRGHDVAIATFYDGGLFAKEGGREAMDHYFHQIAHRSNPERRRGEKR